MTGRRDRDRDRDRGDRDRDREEKKNAKSAAQSAAAVANASGGRSTQFFINGDGIDREVITTDICRYLGNDALVRPGVHKDPRTGQETQGYFITAYRAPTNAQLADLRADSQKWQEERRKNRPGGQYSNSSIRREIWQDPEEPPAAPAYPPTSYNVAPTPNQNTQLRSTYEIPGRGGGYAPNQMPPPGPPGGYREQVAYAPNTGTHYTYRAPEQPTVSYGVQQSGSGIQDSNRGGMDPNPLSRGMPPGPPYSSPPVGMPTAPPGYGRAAGYTYPGQQAMPQGYGGQTQDNYQPYGPRDPGATPENAENYYDNDENEMDYEDSPAPASAVPQPRARDRDRDRDHEPSRKHRHR